MNIWEVLILFFSFQAVLLALLFLVRSRGDRTANRILALFLLVFAYNQFYNVLFWSRFDFGVFAFLFLSDEIPIALYGGLFFLYVRRVVAGSNFRWRDALHILPFLFVLLRFGNFYLLPLQAKIDALKNREAMKHILYFEWGTSLLIAIMLGYGLYTYFRFVKYFQKDPDLRIWLRAISTTFILFVLSHVVYLSLVSLSLIKIEHDYFITFFMVSFIGLVAYFAFTYSSIFNGKPINEVIPFVKYQRTGLSKEFSEELKTKLLHLMENKKPYLDSNIRLDNIAQMLDVSRHHASQIINEHFSMNFFDFINSYRIKEAERLLSSEETQHFSVTDIAFLSGFNNRISFYKAFKKIEGITPSEFREHNMVP